MKFGGQYSFPFGLTLSLLYEDLHREVPAGTRAPERAPANRQVGLGGGAGLERRPGPSRGRLGARRRRVWEIRADSTTCNPNGIGQNQANMYAFEYWHKLDKQLTMYFDVAETINDGNAHYDIGAGGHGIKDDCHDAAHPQFIDYSSAGPTTWGGCHNLGFSTGVRYTF